LLHFGFCLLLSALVWVFPIAVQGQTDSLPIEEWAATAERAIGVLEDQGTSNAEFEALRTDLSTQRGDALEAQDTLRARVETLEAELETLGPAPEEGGTEAFEIAEERAQLVAAITAAKVPLLRAQAAYERADGLIGEIDAVVRGRLSDELTNLGPSPLNPVHWPTAASELVGAGEGVVGGVQEALDNPFLRAKWTGRIPFGLLLVLLGLVVQLFGKPRAIRHLNVMYLASPEGGWRPIWHTAIGVARNLLPLIAAVAVIMGLDQLDPRSSDSTSIMVALVPMAFVVLLAYWLANALFSPDDICAVLRA